MKKLELSNELETFIDGTNCYYGFKICANHACKSKNIKIIVISSDSIYLNINTFCEKQQCISDYFTYTHTKIPLFMKIKCDSYEDVFNRTSEILKCIDVINKIELLK